MHVRLQKEGLRLPDAVIAARQACHSCNKLEPRVNRLLTVESMALIIYNKPVGRSGGRALLSQDSGRARRSSGCGPSRAVFSSGAAWRCGHFAPRGFRLHRVARIQHSLRHPLPRDASWRQIIAHQQASTAPELPVDHVLLCLFFPGVPYCDSGASRGGDGNPPSHGFPVWSPRARLPGHEHGEQQSISAHVRRHLLSLT